MAGTDLAVDYGTSNTAAVIRWEDGRVRPLLFDGSPLLPSAVWVAADGRLLTGHDAMRSARWDPSRYEPNAKRRVDDYEVLLGTTHYTVECLISATLARVVEEAVRTLGAAPDRVALSHPAAWGASRRQVLIDAAASAGLTQVTLVPEPVAAAAFLATLPGHEQADGASILIYDLGAGTFDASVVRRAGTGFETLAYRGLDDLGGLDFDAVIVAHIGLGVPEGDRARFHHVLNPDDAESRRLNRMLWEDARAAKELLSRESLTGLNIPGVAHETVITRSEFEVLAKLLLDRTLTVTRATLRESQLSANELGTVFLVGGGSRIPLVATLLHRSIGIPPTVLEQPELVVAEGTLRAVEYYPTSAVTPRVPRSHRVSEPFVAAQPSTVDQPATAPPFVPTTPEPAPAPQESVEPQPELDVVASSELAPPTASSTYAAWPPPASGPGPRARRRQRIRIGILVLAAVTTAATITAIGVNAYASRNDGSFTANVSDCLVGTNAQTIKRVYCSEPHTWTVASKTGNVRQADSANACPSLSTSLILWYGDAGGVGTAYCLAKAY